MTRRPGAIMANSSPRNNKRRYAPVGDYEILAHIATGGMGVVYQAKHTKTAQIVALKVLSPNLASNATLLERFRREAHRGVRLRHENLVTMYEFNSTNGIHYLALEFVDGPDLHDYVAEKGPLGTPEATKLLIHAARVLQYLHAHQLVHRDIKPSNFLIARGDDQQLMKLTDLGLSRELHDEEFRVTKTDHTVGTIDYMAPEQARSSRLADIRSDIYSLGCTAYHMLTGRPPFPDGGLMERLCKHAESAPMDVRQLNSQVTPALAAVVHKMLAKKPCDRQQTPTQLLEELEQILAPRETPSSARRKAPRIKANESPSQSFSAPSPAGRRVRPLTADVGPSAGNGAAPAPAVAAEQQHAAAGQFERARQVLMTGNIDYGIHLLLSCCQIDPVNLTYRKMLRRIEKTKYRDNRRGSWFAWATNWAAKARLKTARRTGDHWRVLHEGERVLRRNPWEIETQCQMSRAAEKLGLLDLAIWCLEEVLHCNAHIVGIHRTLGRLYENQGNLAKAVVHWQRVADNDATDVEAARQVQNLSARETIQRGGYVTNTLDTSPQSQTVKLRRAQ